MTQPYPYLIEGREVVSDRPLAQVRHIEISRNGNTEVKIGRGLMLNKIKLKRDLTHIDIEFSRT